MSAQRETRPAGLARQLGRRWPAPVAIIVMWIALWGQPTIANILGGAVVAVAVLVLARSVKPRPVDYFAFQPAVLYLRTFARQLVIATWEVIKAVVHPDTIRPGILAVRLSHASDAVVTLVANSITLTPGTLTLETERDGDTAVLYVHALDLADEMGVRASVSELEKLAVDAFAGPDAQAVQARALADLEEADAAQTDADPAGDAAHAEGAERAGDADRAEEDPT